MGGAFLIMTSVDRLKIWFLCFALVQTTFLCNVNALDCPHYLSTGYNPISIKELSDGVDYNSIIECHNETTNSYDQFNNKIVLGYYYLNRDIDSSRYYFEEAKHLCFTNTDFDDDAKAFSLFSSSLVLEKLGFNNYSTQLLEEALFFARNKKLILLIRYSVDNLLSRDEINNIYERKFPQKDLNKIFIISLAYGLAANSELEGKKFSDVLRFVDDLDPSYLKLILTARGVIANIRYLENRSISKFERIINTTLEKIKNTQRTEAIKLIFDIAVLNKQGNYKLANHKADTLLSLYEISGNNITTSLNGYNKTYKIEAILLYATTLLYLTRTGTGLNSVKKAYDIYLDLINHLSQPPNNFNQSQNFLAHSYQGLDNILVIAGYLTQKTGDIHYITRAFSALDALKSRGVRLARYEHDRIAQGGNLAKLLLENRRLGQKIFLRQQDCRESPGQECYLALRRLHEERIELGKRISNLLPEDTPPLLERDMEGTIGKIQSNILSDTSCLLLLHAGVHQYSALITPDTVLFKNLRQRNTDVQAYTTYADLLARQVPLDSIAESGRTVFDLYFADYRPFLRQRVHIVGNGAFETFPFGALPTNATGTNRYLAEDYQLSYHFSLRSLIDDYQDSRYTKREEGLLALAPHFGSRTQYVSLNRGGGVQRRELNPLLYNHFEVTNLAERFPGRYYFDDEADRSSFLAAASDYGILHLATHAVADGELGRQSAFFLADPSGSTPIRAGEVEQFALDADLVTLSACQTGLGTRLSSEGTVGLTRAFSQAGARSVLSTLWSVNDQTTAEIVIDFYTQLASGSDKTSALQKAQQNFLRKHRGTEKAHPHYWAGLVVVGNADAVEWLANPSAGFPWWWVGGFIVGAFLIFGIARLGTNR